MSPLPLLVVALLVRPALALDPAAPHAQTVRFEVVSVGAFPAQAMTTASTAAPARLAQGARGRRRRARSVPRSGGGGG